MDDGNSSMFSYQGNDTSELKSSILNNEDAEPEMLLPSHPDEENKDNMLDQLLSLKDDKLQIDIYNVRRFSMKCKKAYEFFQ